MECPNHLSDESKAIFEEMKTSIKAPGRQLMVIQALELLDLANGCRDARLKDGVVATSDRSNITHINTAISVTCPR